jgi:AcrR family transcriptional regulator
MNRPAATRTYVQRDRARAARENTERIYRAALELFVERPLDQITLAAVAERAGVGLQTLIRRVGTKDGLARAVGEWVQPQVTEARGAPPPPDPALVAEAIARHYERWGAMTERMLQQEDVSPALAEQAAGGRIAHRAWIEATFADVLAPLGGAARDRLRAQLVAVTGVQLWHVLRRDEGVSASEAQDAVAQLVAACLSIADRTNHGRES